MTSLETVQQKIQQLGGRLSGSRAFGSPRPGSDYDYWLPIRKLQRYKRWLNEREEPWDSAWTGAITCWPDGQQVEVSDLFPRTQREHDSIKRKARRRW